MDSGHRACTADMRTYAVRVQKCHTAKLLICGTARSRITLQTRNTDQRSAWSRAAEGIGPRCL
jgi:hypothetical protein